MNLRQNVRVWGCREGGCVVGVKLKGWPAPTWSTSYDRERDSVKGLAGPPSGPRAITGGPAPTWSTSSFFPASAPARTSLCPARYLVAECSTRSAPRESTLRGGDRDGVSGENIRCTSSLLKQH